MNYFQEKVILIISPENWSHLFVSKHHFAIELSKQNTVYFLNPPSNEFAVTKTPFKNLCVIDYKPFFPGLRFLPILVQKYFLRSKFKRLEKLTGAHFDCVWSFDNSVFFNFSFLPPETLTISHIVDYSQDFQFEKAASTATICFGVSPLIVKKLLTYNKHSYLIQHGISVPAKTPQRVQLPGIGKFNAMYVGNLSSPYLDLELLNTIIEQHPEVDFYFCGSGTLNLKQKANLINLGTVDHVLLQDYMAAADVLLLIYDVERFPMQLTNAHKVLEYLYSGKVVCSTKLKDYESREDLLCMSDKENFPNMFSDVVKHITDYNSPQKAKVRRDFALANTYEIRLKEIDELVQLLEK